MESGGYWRWMTGATSRYTGTAGGTERMRLTDAGRVGIGTASPSTELEVNGTVKATAFSGDGSSLTNIFGSKDAGVTNEVMFNLGDYYDNSTTTDVYLDNYVWLTPFTVEKIISTAPNYIDFYSSHPAGGNPAGWFAIYKRPTRTSVGARIMANTQAYSAINADSWKRILIDSTPTTLDSGDYWFAFNISNTSITMGYAQGLEPLQILSSSAGSWSNSYISRSVSEHPTGDWSPGGGPPADGSGLSINLNSTEEPVHFRLIV